MMQLAAWWRARTGRERKLIQIAAILLFAILLPAWAYVTAASFRADAAADYASARQISAQVERLSENLGAQGGESSDGSVRGQALAAAQRLGLSAVRMEQAGAGRLRIVFEAADSVAIYRWIEAVGRRGAIVARTSIVRLGGSDLVNAEFEVVQE